MRDAALLDRITVDPAVCSGSPCVRGTVPVSVVLECLVEGLSAGQIGQRLPGVDETDVRACLAYACELVRLISAAPR